MKVEQKSVEWFLVSSLNVFYVIHIRNSILHFQEYTIHDLKKTMEDETITDEERIHHEVKLNAIEETLYRLQRKNHDSLLDFISDYKPTLSGKLWGNDPEYRKTMNELKKKLTHEPV